MTKRALASLLAAAAVLLVVPWTAVAADLATRVEISPFAGVFAHDDDLDRNRGPVFGGRIGYFLTKAWQTELSAEYVATDMEKSGDNADTFLAHLDLLYHFDFTPRLSPYLAAGAGMVNYDTNGESSDTDFMVNYGIGVKYLITDWVGLRLDVRQPVSYSPTAFNLMYTAGLSFFLGGAAVAPAEEAQQQPPAAPPPPPREPTRKPTPKLEPTPREARESAPPKPAPAPTPLTVPVPAELRLALRKIHFDYDEYTLTAKAKRILEENARYLKKYGDVRIRIEGHCDERGTVDYNLALGDRRATSAYQYLLDLGIAADRMSTVTFGKEAPSDPRHNETAWAENRRAEFVEVGP